MSCYAREKRRKSLKTAAAITAAEVGARADNLPRAVVDLSLSSARFGGKIGSTSWPQTGKDLHRDAGVLERTLMRDHTALSGYPFYFIFILENLILFLDILVDNPTPEGKKIPSRTEPKLFLEMLNCTCWGLATGPYWV